MILSLYFNIFTREYVWMMFRGDEYTNNFGYTFNYMGTQDTFTNVLLNSPHNIEELVVTRATKHPRLRKEND
jgi:hypothetical protein